MDPVRAIAASSVLVLTLASCGVLGSDEAAIGSDPTPVAADPIADDAGGADPVAAVAVELEDRIGSGRAVLAATNGVQTVVVTTVDIVVRSDTDAGFRTLASAGVGVRDLAISPDGERALLVMTDGVVALWSIGDEPVEVARFDGAAGGVFRADGSVVVHGAASVRIVAAADGSQLAEWVVPEDRRLGPLAVADDGRVVMALSGGPSPEVATWSGASDPATNAPIASDGNAVVVAGIDAAGGSVAVELRDSVDAFQGRIEVFAIGASTATWSHELESTAGSDAWSLTADGRLIIGANSQVTVVEDAGVVATSAATVTPIERVTRDGLILLSNGSIQRVTTDGVLGEVIEGAAPVIGFHVDPASGVAAFVDIDGSIATVPTDGGAEFVDDFVSAPINDVAVAPDGRVATASASGVVGVRSNDGASTTRLVHDEGSVDSVAFATDENQVATGVAQRRAATAWDDTVSVWDPESSQRVFEIGGEAEDVAGCSFFTNRLRFASDGSFVVSTSHDFTVSVIAVPSGELLHTFAPHGNTVLDIAISPDDSRLVTSADDSTMRVWDLETYELIADHPATMGGYWSLSFLPGNSSVVAGDLSGNLSVIDIATGAPTTTFAGNKLRESRTAVSPDGLIVAAGADGSTVRLWSTQTGEIIGEAAGHSAAVTSIAFFPDSDRFVSSSKDGTAIVWRLAS